MFRANSFAILKEELNRLLTEQDTRKEAAKMFNGVGHSTRAAVMKFLKCASLAVFPRQRVTRCALKYHSSHSHLCARARRCEEVGGREPLRQPRTRRDSHTIVAPTRARSRSTSLSIYLSCKVRDLRNVCVSCP